MTDQARLRRLVHTRRNRLGHGNGCRGPYEFQSVALPAHGGNFWEGHSVFNIDVVNIGAKFYRYYTGNYGTTNWATNRAIPMSSEEWWIHRNHQRIGVAVADLPHGP